MSTRLTKFDTPQMVDSQTLRLYHATRVFQENLARILGQKLKERGFPGLTPAHLAIMSELDCSHENHAAELARRAGVSRQAVHKQVKDLISKGFAEDSVDEEKRNQRTIRFTNKGVDLMAECRNVLLEMDKYFLKIKIDNRIDDIIEILKYNE